MKTNLELIEKLKFAAPIPVVVQGDDGRLFEVVAVRYKSFVLNKKGAYVLTIEPCVVEIPTTPWETLVTIHKELLDMDPEDMTTAEKNIWNKLYVLGIAKDGV